MRWITSKDEFERVRLQAAECKYIDSGRLHTSLQRWIFDDAEMFTPQFANLVHQLIGWSGDIYLNPPKNTPSIAEALDGDEFGIVGGSLTINLCYK